MDSSKGMKLAGGLFLLAAIIIDLAGIVLPSVTVLPIGMLFTSAGLMFFVIGRAKQLKKGENDNACR